MQLRSLIIAAAGLTLAMGAGAASAATPWQAHHPARAEVNHRLHHMNRLIRKERHEGDLTAAQAGRLHERERMIRTHERRFARAHHSHLTRHELVKLNHQENGVRHHIPS
ncbi:MAG TPA: hypothetical protein VGF50_00015 [Caulobacteraceae bacterium]|jgi:hypothetical protein